VQLPETVVDGFKKLGDVGEFEEERGLFLGFELRWVRVNCARA